MTGYQEILTDPSYCGQIVVMTYPEIGNVGVNAEDVEVRAALRRGLHRQGVLGDARATGAPGSRCTSTWCEHGIPGIQGIDTRALVRLHSRPRARSTPCSRPAMRTTPRLVDKAQARAEHGRAGPRPAGDLRERLRLDRGRSGSSTAVTAAAARRPAPSWSPTTSASSATSCAISSTPAAGCASFPPTTPAADVLAMQPDGIFLSNGPGDPAAVPVRGAQSCASWSARSRSSASASATRSSGSPSAARRTSSSSATTAATSRSWT